MCEKLGYTEAQKAVLSLEEATPTVFEFGQDLRDAGRGGGLTAPLPLPERCMLTHIQIYGLDKGAEPPRPTTTITWWLALDEYGEQPITDRMVTTWNPAVNAQRVGGAVCRVGYPFVATRDSRNLFLFVYVTDGSAAPECRAAAYWYTMSDADLTKTHAERLTSRKAEC